MEEKNILTEYMGVYDHKESNTFRPTVESRIHKDSPVAKTMTCREDSCCVITRERERRILVLIFVFANLCRWKHSNLWGLIRKTMRRCEKSVKVMHKSITSVEIVLSLQYWHLSSHHYLTT